MRRLALAFLLLASTASNAGAARVETLRSYWNDDRSAILSDVVVEHDDGTMESRQVLGGSVDGIGMIQIAEYATGALLVEYVPTTNASGAKLRWAGSCVFITPDSNGSSAIPMSGVIDAITGAANAWNNQAASCSYLRFHINAAESLEVGYDGKNTVKFRETKWCRPANGSTPEKCYDAAATAITTLMFIDDKSRPDNGTILDTDVEVNGVDYAMATNCDTRCVTQATHGVVEDLQNTLTHEFGHVIGLAHTCWPGDPSNAPLDDEGIPAPSCRSAQPLPKSVTEATMYNFQDPGETKKRTLEQDDIDGDCKTYPIASDPKVCEAVQIAGKGGCAVGGGSAGGGGLLVALAALLTARACSRTRRRSGCAAASCGRPRPSAAA